MWKGTIFHRGGRTKKRRIGRKNMRVGSGQEHLAPIIPKGTTDRISLSRTRIKTLQRRWGDMEQLLGVLALRRLAFNAARRPSYTPCTLELRLFSRETVLTQTPMVLAMKLSEHFFCSNTLIVYLCSEVNCLYICNTKLINLREGDECSPPFLHCLSLPPGSSGASRPRPQGKPRGVFHMSNTTKILHFYLERAF